MIEMLDSTTPLVSVVVTTRNEETMIKDCIISIFEQSYPNFELIIIDAKSSDGTFEKIGEMERLSKSFKNCKRYLFLSREADSPAKGRNIGVKAAYGNIVAFTDADCIAERDWLITLVTYIPKELGGVGGPNLLRHLRRSKIVDAIDNVLGTYLGSGGSPQFLRIEKVCEVYAIPSCNFAIQKSLFDTLGGFDERLRSSEDADLCNRIRDKGYKIIYTPQAKVNHFMGLDSFSAFARTIFKYGSEAGKNSAHNLKLFQRFRFLSVAFTIAFLNLAALSFFIRIAFVITIAIIFLVTLIVAITSLKIGLQKRSPALTFLSIPIFFSIFTFYNAGFLFGYLFAHKTVS
jgi:GT2 family glycosyltransferase